MAARFTSQVLPACLLSLSSILAARWPAPAAAERTSPLPRFHSCAASTVVKEQRSGLRAGIVSSFPPYTRLAAWRMMSHSRPDFLASPRANGLSGDMMSASTFLAVRPYMSAASPAVSTSFSGLGNEISLASDTSTVPSGTTAAADGIASTCTRGGR